MHSPCKTMGLNSGVTSILALCVLVAAITCHLISRWKNKKINAFMASIPGPTPILLIGTMYKYIGLNADNLWRTMRSIAEEYPKISAIWICNQPVLVTSDLEIFNAVWNNSQLTNKIPEYNRFENGFKGIFTLNGSEWRTTRKILNPCFRSNILAAMDEKIRRPMKTYFSKLEKHADNGEEFDIVPPVQLFSLDSILDFASGTSTDCLAQMQDPESFASDMRKASKMLYERVFCPMFWPDWVYALSGKRKVYDALYVKGRGIMRKILDEFVKNKNNQSVVRPGNPKMEKLPMLMEVLLDHADQGAVPKESLVEELIEMVFAAVLTSTCINAWIFQLLAMYPDIQERAYQEILEVTGGKEAIMEDLSKLNQIDMIVKETLRHFTVPAVARQIDIDLQVNDKMTIPSGIRLVMALGALHHDPEYWERPSEFYPEHFSEANTRKRPKGAFVPFTSGIRNCIGYKYAMLTMKILAANTLLHYKFTTTKAPPKDFMRDIDFHNILTLWPIDGYSVKVIKRSLK